MSLAAAKTESWAQGRIPVLDIGAYLAGETGAAAPLARALAGTCEDTGFLVLANHGVPRHLIDDTFAAAERFFARPETDKLALKVGKYNIGYLPFGGQGRAPFASQQEHPAEFTPTSPHGKVMYSGSSKNTCDPDEPTFA